MEILKGFEWDIQRFASYDDDASTAPFDATDGGKYFTTDGSAWVKVGGNAASDIAANSAIAYYEASTTAGVGTLWVKTGDTAIATAAVDCVIKIGTFANEAVQSGSEITAVTATQGAGTLVLTSGNSITLGNSDSVTVNNSAISAASGTVAVASGTIPISGNNIASDLSSAASDTDKVSYTGTLSATSVKTAASGSLALTVTEAGTVAVTKAGSITGLTTGSIVKDLVSGSVQTAATTAGDTVTINGQVYKLGAASTLTFTVTSSTATLTDGTVALASEDNTTVKVTNGTVTVSSGDVTVTKDGVVAGLNPGDIFKIDNVTYTVTKDPTDASNYQITVLGSGSQDGTYTVTKTAADAGNVSITVMTGTDDTLTGFGTNGGIITYQHLDSNGTAALSTIASTNGTTIFYSGASGSTYTEGSTIYGKLAKNAGAYTLTLESTLSGFTSFTVNTASMGSNAVSIASTGYTRSDFVYTNGSWSITDVTATDNLTITGSTINAGTKLTGFTLTSGTVVLGDKGAAGVAVTTNKGKLTVTDTEMGDEDTVRITSEGTVTGLAKTGSSVALEGNTAAADDANPVEFTVNTKTFSAVANEGATIVRDTTGYDYQLTGGALRVAAGATQNLAAASVKVTGGDGIVLYSTGAFNDLEDGETVVVNSGTSIVTYSVSGTTLEISEVAATAGVATGTATTKSYTLDDAAVTFSAVNLADTGLTNAKTPSGVTVVIPSGFGFSNTYNAELAATNTYIADGIYLAKDGVLTQDSSKAVGQFTKQNNTLTYTESASTAQQIVLGTPSTDYDSWSVTTSSGKDTITSAGAVETTINSGAGNDRITIAGTTTSVSAGDGKDEIAVGGTGDHSVDAGAGNDIITSTGTGSQILYGGEGDNKIRHTVATGDSTLWGGSGKDTISSANASDVIIGGDGADTFDIVTGNAKVTISDYTYGTDVLQVAATDATSVLSSSVTPALFTTDGIVSLSGTASADISASKSGGVYAAALVDGNGKNKLNVGWTDDNGGNIDVTSTTDAVVLIGSLNDDAADALYSGSGKDTLYGGSNDSLYGGANADLISLKASTSGAVIGVATTSGKDTVKGFTTGFEDADSIFLVDGSASNVGATLSGSTLTFKDGDGSLELQSISTNSTLGGAELLVSGAKVAVAAKGGTLKTDNINYANYYIGNGSAADFSSVEGAMTVNLANGLDSSAEGPKFKGITTVKGGSASTVLMGATAAESIVAGTGTTSLWGGAGKDTLVGGSGVDTFFIGSGDGADVVTGFVGGTDDTSDSVTTLANITGAKLTSSGVEIAVGDSDKLTLQNVTADTAIKVNANGTELVAKVGSATGANNFTYDSKVSYYGGGNASDKIAFSSNYTDNAEIWLDGSHGKTYASVDVVDGSNTSGNLIAAGDSSSQSIIGGKGNSSLWGGAGSASDTLRSSSNGTTMFWWGMGEGNDVAVSASANDSVNLYNVKLSDVDLNNTAITSSGVTLALNDGSKLTVQTSRDMTFTVDGTSWTANHSSKTWQQNS